MTTATFDKISLALPPYLSEEGKKGLLAQLQEYPSNTDYFGSCADPEPVQGDAWRSLIFLDFDSGDPEAVVGMVLSNSCDITQENFPDPHQNVLFAPILDLEAYSRMLREEGKTKTQVFSTVNAIRRQDIHRIFYLPAIQGIMNESIVLLDHIHSQPIHSVKASARERVFSLSMYGWYVLLVKLSIHFTRMRENVAR